MDGMDTGTGSSIFQRFRADILNATFIAVVLAYCLYAGLFIYRTSFVIEGERFFCLFDDAMVSMRYARNLAHGFGLVWNPGGEKVEGYTNPLWVLYMSLFHLVPLSESKVSLCIQISCVTFLIINLYFVKKIAHLISNGSRSASIGAVFLTAFYLPINNWSLQGMEVGLLTLIISLSLWQALQCIQENRFCIWLYLLLGTGTLVRLDMIVPFVGIGLFLSAADRENRRRNIIWGGLVLLSFCLFQTVFRIWYYGDVLPNTYYLKMTGYPTLLRITRGIFVMWEFIWRMNWILFSLPVGFLFFRNDRMILLLFWVFLAQLLYSIYVGGDAWEWWGGSNRYLCVAMPGFFVLFSCSLSCLCQFLSCVVNGHVGWGEEMNRRTFHVLFSFLMALSFINFNCIYEPGYRALKELALINTPLHVQDNKKNVGEALLIRRITGPQAKIAVVWAGIIPYFSDRYAIDLLGKNDRRIAREKIRISSGLSRLISFYPGHSKWNYRYSIGQLKPDVVAQLWQAPEEAKPYLDKDYRESEMRGIAFYLLKDSPQVLWDQVRGIR